MAVVDRLTTNETYFFREPRTSPTCAGAPQARSPSRPQGDFRVWSAASSSGEEACQRAMAAGRQPRRLALAHPWHRPSTTVVAAARTGCRRWTARRTLDPNSSSATACAVKAHEANC